MDNNIRHIKYGKIKSAVKSIKHHFPCDVKYFHIFKSDERISILFINEENQDVTQKVMNVVLNQKDNITIYDVILSTILSINTFLDKMENGIIYVHNADFNPSVPNYLNYEVLRGLRLKLKDVTVKTLSYKLGLYFTAIYNIENRIAIQYSFDTLYKYSLFFKVSIFKLLNKSFGEQMLSIFLIELMAKNIISKQIADAILKDYQEN